MKFTQPRNANYYDLVRIPHGHIPAPMIKFWSWLPIPVKGQRDWGTFHCPVCGSPSFYKTRYGCNECQYDNEQEWKSYRQRERKRRNWKRLEHFLLPLYVLFGKAWYMPSVKLTHLEQVRKYGPPIQIEIDWNQETGEHCAICGKAITLEEELQYPDHPLCCEEHGDYLPMCASYNDFWGYNSDQKGCIREWFRENTDGKLPISIKCAETQER